MNRKGFTLIELILVIAILGILAVSALPKFLNLSTSAKQAARDGVVGAVRSGIALYRANQMVSGNAAATYPPTLDSQANAACTTCFDGVLANGVNDSSWVRASDTSYTYNDQTGNIATFAYNTTNGTFQ